MECFIDLIVAKIMVGEIQIEHSSAGRKPENFDVLCFLNFKLNEFQFGIQVINLTQD